MGNKIIKTYDSIYDDRGNRKRNLLYLVANLEGIDSNGDFMYYSIGTSNITSKESIIFIVDHNIREQMEGIRLSFEEGRPVLREKEGFTFKTLEEQETPEERQIRLLEEQIAALKASMGIK